MWTPYKQTILCQFNMRVNLTAAAAPKRARPQKRTRKDRVDVDFILKFCLVWGAQQGFLCGISNETKCSPIDTRDGTGRPFLSTLLAFRTKAGRGCSRKSDDLMHQIIVLPEHYFEVPFNYCVRQIHPHTGMQSPPSPGYIWRWTQHKKVRRRESILDLVGLLQTTGACVQLRVVLLYCR